MMRNALDQFRLDGRVALITGGDKGLGQGIAIALAQAGADVAVVSRSGNATVTLDAVAAAGRRGVALTADLSRTASIDRIVTETIAQLGRIDILVNNAGIIRRAPAIDYGWNDWRAVLDVNLDAVWALCQRPDA